MKRPRIISRVVRVAVDEIENVLSRQMLARLASPLPDAAFATTRTALFRAAGASIGAHSLIQGRLRVTGKGNPCALLHIGESTLITGGLHVDLGAPVRIGSRVRIGHDVSLLTISHEIGHFYLRAGTSFFGEIVIEDGAWIASRVVILPGVVIGRGAIVAAGAVVTRSVPPNTLVAGVPARVMRDLPEDGFETANDRVRPSERASLA